MTHEGQCLVQERRCLSGLALQNDQGYKIERSRCIEATLSMAHAPTDQSIGLVVWPPNHIGILQALLL